MALLMRIAPIAQSDALVAKLKVLEIPHTYDRLEGWPYTMDVAELSFNRCTLFIDQFLAQHMPLPAQPTDLGS